MPRESFKEFKQIIQGEKLERQKKKKDWWHAPFRFVSKYITWILVKSSVTPNFITITGFLIGLIGLLLIGIGNNLFIIIGFILVYIYYVSDEIDGEVARYKKQVSIRGIYYDEIGHLLFLGVFFFSFGYSIFRFNSEFIYVIFGLLSSFFLSGIRITRKIPILLSTKTEILKHIETEHEIMEKINSKKGFKTIFKKIMLNLINGFTHQTPITTIFFIGFLIFINVGFLMILEVIMIFYFFFMFIIFIIFIFKTSKGIEENVLERYRSQQST